MHWSVESQFKGIKYQAGKDRTIKEISADHPAWGLRPEGNVDKGLAVVVGQAPIATGTGM